MIEQILKDDFVDYRIVKEKLKEAGLKNTDIKKEKIQFGVKTIELCSEKGEKGWLWYIPKNMWNRYFAGK